MMKLKYLFDQCKLAQTGKLHKNPYEILVNLHIRFVNTMKDTGTNIQSSFRSSVQALKLTS